MPHPKLDRDQLSIKKLDERYNKLSIENDQIPVSQKPANLSDQGKKLLTGSDQQDKNKNP
jgi:hypothetical protein